MRFLLKLTITILTFFTLFLIFKEFQKGFENWQSLIVIIIIILLVLVTCCIIKFCLIVREWENTTSIKEGCRKNWLIGYSGMAICGYIPQVMVMSVDGKTSEIVPSCLIVCNIAAITFAGFFLFSYKGFAINKIHCQKLIIYAIHLGYIILEHTLFRYVVAPERANWVTGITITYVICFMDSTANAWLIWRHGVVLKSHNDSQCNICLHQFNNIVIPRILIQCGHTLCEECVEKVMKHQIVACPFCRKLSFVPHGSAAGLPKNFALLGLMQERRY